MKRLRKDAGLTGRELEKRTGISQPKISSIECARVMPALGDVELIAEAIGLDQRARDQLLAQAAVLCDKWDNIKRRERSRRSRREFNWPAVEGDLTTLDVFTLTMIPAILQTRGYGYEVLVGYGLGSERLDSELASRRQRRSIVEDPKRTFRFLMLEAALYTPPGSISNLIEQLDALLPMFAMPNVEIAIVPFFTPLGLALVNNFAVMDGALVAIEFLTAVNVLEGPETGRYLEIFEENWGLAAHGEDAKNLISKAIKLASNESKRA